MAENDANALLDRAAKHLGLIVVRILGSGYWTFKASCQKWKCVDNSRVVHLYSVNRMMNCFFENKLEMLECLLCSRCMSIPVKYNDYGCLVSDTDVVANPFYRITTEELAIKLDLLED